MSDVQPVLSLVLPVHRGAAFIARSIGVVLAELSELGVPFEVLVVSDGCQDATAEIALACGDPRVRVVSYPENRGKGFALCAGAAYAEGTYVGWLDADLDISPRVIVDAYRRLTSHDLDVVVGSKRHPSSAVQYPWQRRALSWGYQRFVAASLRVDVSDTQVGAKVFRREVLDTVVPLLLVKRYAFDLEVLAVAALFGFDRIEEAPIALDYRFTGTGVGAAAVRNMFVDTLAITYRVRFRHWYVRQFAQQQRRRVAADDVPHALARDLQDVVGVDAGNIALLRELQGLDVRRADATVGQCCASIESL